MNGHPKSGTPTTSPANPAPFLDSIWKSNELVFTLMLVPAFVVICLVFLYPIFTTIHLSFFKYSLMSRKQFYGIRNYVYIFENPVFYATLLRNIIYVVFVVGMNVVIGMIMALLTRRDYRGVITVRTIFIVPMFFIPATAAAVWTMLLDQNVGLINHFIKAFGFQPQMWLAKPKTAFLWIMIADIWSWTPFMYLTFLAGLRDLPKEPYEAAMLDGASSFKQFWFLTIPLMRGIIAAAVILKSLGTFRTFVYTWVMTKGGPGDATQVLSTLTYWEGITNYNYGYASAMSTVILLISIALSVLLIFYFRRSES